EPLPTYTLVVPVKLDPVIINSDPVGPEDGEKELMIGAPLTVNRAVVVACPSVVITLTVPVAVTVGTFTLICVSLTTVKDVVDPVPTYTLVAFVKFVPRIVTSVPTGPDSGVKELIVGALVKVNVPDEVLVPSFVRTCTLPLADRAGALTLIS